MGNLGRARKPLCTPTAVLEAAGVAGTKSTLVVETISLESAKASASVSLKGSVHSTHATTSLVRARRAYPQIVGIDYVAPATGEIARCQRPTVLRCRAGRVLRMVYRLSACNVNRIIGRDPLTHLQPLYAPLQVAARVCISFILPWHPPSSQLLGCPQVLEVARHGHVA
jgi:hypothetical protein